MQVFALRSIDFRFVYSNRLHGIFFRVLWLIFACKAGTFAHLELWSQHACCDWNKCANGLCSDSSEKLAWTCARERVNLRCYIIFRKCYRQTYDPSLVCKASSYCCCLSCCKRTFPSMHTLTPSDSGKLWPFILPSDQGTSEREEKNKWKTSFPRIHAVGIWI